MKVIKRDGRAVDYNREKIHVAISKANMEVKPKERATKEEIRAITDYIESLNRKRLLVEDIQDLIEEQLMEFNRFELAKKYIIYRYNRALIRKQNTTDESILGLIKASNSPFMEENANSENSLLASNQRDLIAGEVSKDLTKRILLPEKISSAHEEGILHFHDSDYFLQPIFNCSFPSIGEMLDNGTVINGKLIESPKNFQSACLILTQIIATIASNQYGSQSIDISHLGKYLRKSYDTLKKQFSDNYPENFSETMIEPFFKEELSSGIKVIYSQLNTLASINKHSSVTLFLHLKEDDPFIKENAIIIEEILTQYNTGMKNEGNELILPTLPELVYVLDENNALKGGKYDYLTKLTISCSSKGGLVKYISAKKMRENYQGNVFSPIGDRMFLTPWQNADGEYQSEGRFNQGIVSINLPQIGILSGDDEEKFWKLLEERLDLCYEALMCRHYALLGTVSDVSPIHWQHGAIAHLEKCEKIDKLLRDGYSTISLGYIGLYEVTKLVKGVSHTTSEGHDFALKVLKRLRKTTDDWKKKTGLGFTLYATPSENIARRFACIDREKYGIIKDVTDKGYYTDSYHVDIREQLDIFEKLDFESDFQTISSGGTISYIEISANKQAPENFENAIAYIFENLLYSQITLISAGNRSNKNGK